MGSPAGPVVGFPLSPQQRRVWALQQAGGQAYRVQGVLRLDGRLDVERLEAALHRVMSRHEILRTCFRAGPQAAVQVIGAEPLARLERDDLCSLTADAQAERLETLLIEQGAAPVDFARLPLARGALVQLSSERHRLLVSWPALCGDRASLENLLTELGHAYAGMPPASGENAEGEIMQYADIAAWADELLLAPEAETAREFWRQAAMRFTPGAGLPFADPVAPASGFEPRRLQLTIEAEDALRLDSLAHQLGSSSERVLLACYQSQLWRLVGVPVTVGVAFDGRRHPGLRGALGLLAGYLPLPCELSLSLPFHDAVKWLDTATRQAQDRQELFDWERFWAGSSEADPRSFLLFGFDFATLPADFSLGGVRFGLARARVCLERFVLRLSCTRSAEGLTAELVYDSNALAAADVERLADGFRTLLRGVLDAPGSRVGDLDLLGATERRRVIVEFNDTALDYPRDKCVHELIEEQAQRNPQATAVSFEGHALSYADLDARANRLAHRLQRLGVGPEVLVALCFERSLEMVVALLGVLKAGGAYVPLDPKYPEERLRFMLEETDARVLLTQSHLADALPAHRAQVLCLDRESADEAGERPLRPASSVTPRNLAYVIYTSGSTGRPKGVMISHQGLVMSTTARFPFFDVDVERFLLLSPLPFDSSVVGIYWTLCRGGTLVLVRDERQQDVARLAETIAAEQVSHLLTLPSFWALVLEHARPEQLAGLKTVIVAGEPCPRRLVDQHYERLPGTALINEYGATENTVWCSAYDCRALALLVAPLGQPIANARLYVLDEASRPVPIGVAGELYSGGEALARGYWSRPDMTAERFVPDPFSGRPGARLYRSGDLARYLPDGNVEFLGRVDNQVKIRGFRIELPEIEAALAAHPSISDAVVTAREDDPGQGKRLVAYLVAESSAGVAAKDLRGYLKGRLPEFMVPSAFVLLDSLPRMPNGKVDRRALPAPEPGAPLAAESWVAPRNPIEELLAEVWRKVLGVAQVGVHDNFFDLGGDSLLSIQVVARANQKGLGLTPRQLFQHQTLAELAAAVGTTRIRVADQGLVTGELPLTPVQHWFFELGLPAPQHWNMPLFLEVLRPLDPAQVEEVLSALVRHHDALRLRFRRAGDAWRQTIVATDAPVPLERVDLSSLPEPQQAAAIEAAASESQRRLDLGQGPLLHAVWFELGRERPARLLLIVHHLAVDGVSWRILLEDLQVGLSQRREGQAIRFPLKTTSYREWAERLQRDAASGAWAEQLPYWRSLERAEAWRLPLDRPGGINSEASARKVSAGLNADETQALLQKVPRAYRTQINDVLLTALVEAFAEWTGRRSLLLNLEGHGREDVLEGVDLSRTVGWFTTDFPVALELGGRHGPGESLTEVKEQLRSVPNQGIGYGVLRYLSVDPAAAGALARLPRPEVAFNYMGQFDQTLDEASLFRLARESSGPAQAPEGPRPFPLEIYGMVSEGRFTLDWEYSANIFERSTVESLARGYLSALRNLIDHCLSPDAGAYTASDLTAYNWSQGDLDEIAAAIRKSQDR